jgi:hypothetical protein
MGRFFRVHKDEPWMKAMLLRIKEEKHTPNKITKGTIMDIFPEPTRMCTPGFKKRNAKCSTLLEELWDLGAVSQYEVNPDTMEDILDIFGFDKYSP